MSSSQRWRETGEEIEGYVGKFLLLLQAFKLNYIDPTIRYTERGILLIFSPCIRQRVDSATVNLRRESQHFFFDLYDEDAALGREELERLLADEEENSSPFDHDREEISYGRESPEPSAKNATLSSQSLWYLMGRVFDWKSAKRHSLLSYKPSTADLRETAFFGSNRQRSTTNPSITSSATYRSRRDLISDSEAIDEDAQVMSDNFATDLLYGDMQSKISSADSMASMADSVLSSKISSVVRTADISNDSCGVPVLELDKTERACEPDSGTVTAEIKQQPGPSDC